MEANQGGLGSQFYRLRRTNGSHRMSGERKTLLNRKHFEQPARMPAFAFFASAGGRSQSGETSSGRFPAAGLERREQQTMCLVRTDALALCAAERRAERTRGLRLRHLGACDPAKPTGERREESSKQCATARNDGLKQRQTIGEWRSTVWFSLVLLLQLVQRKMSAA